MNKSWRQHFTKQQLHGHLPPITKTIQVRRTRYAGHCWRSKDKLSCDILLWTPLYGRAKVGRPARTYIQQLCTVTGCNLFFVSPAFSLHHRKYMRGGLRRALDSVLGCDIVVSKFGLP